MVSIGRVYRRDTPDPTHFPIFHQFEGLAVDRGITLADLKGTLAHLMRALFGEDREVRFRTHNFPFTEPSIEPDVSCPICDFAGCRMCKSLGLDRAGRRRDGRPAACSSTSASTPRSGRGFAFGCGLERIAMLRHGITEIRELLGERPPRPAAVLAMKRPALLARGVRRVRRAAGGARRGARVSIAEVEGVIQRSASPTSTETSAATASAACSRRASTRMPTGSSSAASTWGRASRGRSSAARGTSARAPRSRSRCRARCCRAGPARARQAARRGLRRDDPVGARARARPRPQRHPRPRRRAEPGTPLGDVLPSGRGRARGRGRRTTARPPLGLRLRARRRHALGRRARSAAGRGRGARRATSRSTSGSRTSRGARATSAGSSATSRSGRRPPWLRARLAAAGMRPISNVVDVTNYVMLGLGNPLHAFDFAKLGEGRIVVRRARPGEEIRTLDGELRRLDAARPPDRRRRAAGRARRDHGRRGDARSPTRRRASCSRRRTSSRSGSARAPSGMRLRTEGSNRWEKGVDPYLAEQAAVLATQLLVELAGAALAGPRPTCRASCPSGRSSAPPAAGGRRDRARGRTGRAGRDPRAARLRASRTPDVRVPTWRARDLTREIDLVEEVARSVLDRRPVHAAAPAAPCRGRLSREQRLRRRLEDVLVGLGFAEVFTWSLAAADDRDPSAIRLQEPLSTELAILRTSSCRAWSTPPRRNVDAGNRRHRPLRDRTRLPSDAASSSPTSAAPRRDPRGRLRRGEGCGRGDLRRAQGRRRSSLRPSTLSSTRARPRRTEAGVCRRGAPGAARGQLGRVRARPRRAVRASPEPVRYEDVISFPPVRQDLAFIVAEDVRGGRPDRRGARGGRARAARDARL